MSLMKAPKITPISAHLLLWFMVSGLVFLCFGCSTTAHFYPIAGPISTQLPIPVIKAKASGITGNSGGISLKMPDGEVLKGTWSSIAPKHVNSSHIAMSGVGTGLTTVWTQVYGSGYTVGNVPGTNRGEAMLVGERGTTMQVEFYTGSGTANGNGVAKDNKGNMYKVIF
jgi:hypothetical protein